MNNFITILTLIAPVLAAALTGGGIVAYFSYLSKKPESLAQARNLNITAEISLAEGWQKYAKNIEVRLNDIETKYDLAIKQKDEEIEMLTKRVNELTRELDKYRAMDNSRTQEDLNKTKI